MDNQTSPFANRTRVLAILFLLACLPWMGCNPDPASNKDQASLSFLYQTDLDKKAVFRDQSGKTITEYVQQQVRLPKETKGLPTEGNVGLRFTVKQDGTLEKVAVTEKLHPTLDREAVRILQSTSGKWEPAQADGKPVPSEVSLLLPASSFTPVTFPDAPKETIYSWVEKMPSFEGGDPGLMDFLKKNLSAAGPKGLVVLSFVIRKDGRLEDIEVIKSLSPAQDAEALRVVRLMEGKWKPGQQEGKNLNVRYTLPVRYE